MNNDASSSAAAQPSSSAAASSDHGSATGTSDVAPEPMTAQQRLQVQSQKKNDLLAGLLDNIDSVVYMELAVLYYMDNSLFRFLIRAVSQLMFLTPTPAFLPAAPHRQPSLGAIFTTNTICMLLHILTARSEGREELRGYLHGGVIIDLIGQKGPTSKIHLVILDLLVCILQCVMMTMILEKERIAKIVADLKGGIRVEAVSGEEQSTTAERDPQDADAEERGVLRHGMTNSEDLEMTTLTAAGTATTSEDEERRRLLADPAIADEGTTAAQDDADSHPLDMFYSRTATIATFHVLPALKTQWNDYGNASGSALQTVGFSAEFARVAASRRLGAAQQRLNALA